jgi:predicted  nucleic acid-binding Zn-ribbon protein
MSSVVQSRTARELQKLRELRETLRTSLAKWKRHESDVQFMLSRTRDKVSTARETASDVLGEIEDMEAELRRVEDDSGAEARARRRRWRDPPVVDAEYDRYEDDVAWKIAKMQWKLDRLEEEYRASRKEVEDASKQCDKLEEDLRSAGENVSTLERQIESCGADIWALEERLARD